MYIYESFDRLCVYEMLIVKIGGNKYKIMIICEQYAKEVLVKT